jgi:hypothetical protein
MTRPTDWKELAFAEGERGAFETASSGPIPSYDFGAIGNAPHMCMAGGYSRQPKGKYDPSKPYDFRVQQAAGCALALHRNAHLSMGIAVSRAATKYHVDPSEVGLVLSERAAVKRMGGSR